MVVGETHTVLFSLRLMYAWMRCTLSLSLWGDERWNEGPAGWEGEVVCLVKACDDVRNRYSPHDPKSSIFAPATATSTIPLSDFTNSFN